MTQQTWKKWTLVVRNIENKFVALIHYERKKDAIRELQDRTSLGYRVEMMAYSVWITSIKPTEEES